MDKQELLRALPKVDELMKRPDVAGMLDSNPRTLVLESLRDSIESARASILEGAETGSSEDAIVADAAALLSAKTTTSLERVINATGIVIHTNLGRSPMAEEAVAAVDEIARGYSTLEYDAETGERGSRHVHVEDLIKRLTGAEAAMAVNNNAAAVLLALSGLASGKEVVVSRGQLVEIGGSFRIPDIMSQSGAKMVEVGTTNKTHLRDYENALSPNTGMLLKVHTSNFRLVGFTEEVPLSDLVALGAEHGIPVYEDQGSGVLVDLAPFGLPGEPTIGQAVSSGADVVSASGDKLLGGPQAGILAGKWHVIEKLKKHPLARALRLDKMTLAALEATLRLYLEPDKARQRIPTLRMLTMTQDEARERAQSLASRIAEKCGDSCTTGVADDLSRSGGGALPMVDIPTVVATVEPKSLPVVELESRLRLGSPRVVARIKEDRLLLDPRTLLPGEDDEVVSAIASVIGG